MKSIMFVLAMAFSTSALSATVCEPKPSGGICCWDTDKYGPFKPLVCQ